MVLTLTTDWGNEYYPAAFKGLIYSYKPECTIIDITHNIPAYNLSYAAFSLRNTYELFPAGSVHVIGVGNDYSSTNSFLVVYANEHYFLCNDNGVIGLILDNEPDKVIEIDVVTDDNSPTFPALSVFAPIAIQLLNGANIESFGHIKKDYNKSVQLLPTYTSSVITGTIVYIDTYGNAITNITNDLFCQIGQNSQFEIHLKSMDRVIKRISQRYNEVGSGNLVAVFNALGYLEIAVNHGRVCDLFGLKCNDNIRIQFLK